MSNERTQPIELTISGLIEDLHNGITRCKGDVGYDEERGSIQEKYGLTKAEVKEIFRHEKLAGLKIRIPETPKFILIDDTESKNTEETSETPSETTTSERKYGKPSAAAEKRMEQADTEVESTTTEEMPATENVAESVDF